MANAKENFLEALKILKRTVKESGKGAQPGFNLLFYENCAQLGIDPEKAKEAVLYDDVSIESLHTSLTVTMDPLAATVAAKIESEILVAIVAKLDHKPTDEESKACLNNKVSPHHTDYFWNQTPLIRVHKLTSLDDAANLRIDRLWLKQ